jgi:chitinase
MQQVGSEIDWLNVQFYNNLPWNGAENIVTSYKLFTELQGCSPEKLLVGLLVSEADGGSGYLSIETIVKDVIGPLEATYPNTFAGIMGWQFSGDPSGSWAVDIGTALKLTT